MSLIPPLEVLNRYPRHDYTLNGLHASRKTSHPDRTFIIFQDRTWTWGGFDEAVERTARMLLGKSIRKGDRVGLMATNSDAHVLLLFALARIGAIMVPVNPEFGLNEAKYVLTHAGVSAVACSLSTLDICKDACKEIQPTPWFMLVDGDTHGIPNLFDLLTSAPSGPPLPAMSADDTCVIIYSSGTTGFPKGVMHSQRSFVLSGERQVERIHLQPDDRYLCVLPMFHINALFYSVAGSVTAGAHLIISPKFSASQFWRLVKDSDATVVNLIMAVLTILVRRPRSEFVPGHRLRVVSAAPFTKETVDGFTKDFGVERTIEGFGMTEIPGAFSNPYDGLTKVGTMGKPGVHADPKVAWAQARIIGDDGKDVPNNVTGELIVRIPTMMQGYYRDPEQTLASFHDGWFLTGDLVKRDDDGYFHFVARKKDIIRRRGENVAGAELDRVIAEHPAVSEVAAIAVDAELGEDEILAAIVRKSGHSLKEAEIRDWCAARLATHKVPRFVVFVDELPHTPTHKVAKFLLKQDKSLRSKAVDFRPA